MQIRIQQDQIRLRQDEINTRKYKCRIAPAVRIYKLIIPMACFILNSGDGDAFMLDHEVRSPFYIFFLL